MKSESARLPFTSNHLMSLVAISTTTHQSSLVALATAVHEQCGWVVNSLQVAALLESMGINDVTAQQQYGYSDVFVLAEKIMAHLPRTVTPAEVHPPTPLLPPETWRDWVKNYGHREGTGFVQLWMQANTLHLLGEVRKIAEYGIE